MKNLLLLSAAILGLVGCNASDDTATQTEVSSTPAVTPASNELLSRLVAADKLDGQEDKVIGKCYVCGLSMDGDAKHATELHGYKAHLCSEYCVDHFKKEGEQVVMSTELPEVTEDAPAQN